MGRLTKKRLIIAPHFDDEVLGCGGILSKYKDDEFFVFFMTMPKNEVRLQEAIKVREYLGLPQTRFFSLGYTDSGESFKGSMHDLGVANVADRIGKLIYGINFDSIYIPFKSLHQDHQITNIASLIALRKTTGSIYEYEYTDMFSQFQMLEVDTFEKLSVEDLKFKCDLMQLYESQINSNRDTVAIESLAKIRGYQSSCDYAEGFRLIRRINL